MSGTDASESIRSIAGGWGSVFCRLIILQLAACFCGKQKSPLNKKQATRALCKQSSTHLGRRSGESNRLAHAIEQHLPISSDCTKLLVAVCSYGQGLSIDMLSLLGGALFTQAAHRSPFRRSASPALRPPPLMGGGSVCLY